MRYNISDIQNNIIGKLIDNLPEYLSYHNVEHTLYVAEKAAFLCEKESVTGKDRDLVYIAALYHDSGFLRGPKDHEEESCRIVKKDLKKNFTNEDLQKICGMIMATKIPQNPSTLNEKILADADLEYLGTTLFEETGERLFREMKHFNPSFTRQKWNALQISFLSNHTYKTKFCQQYREKYKQNHLSRLIEKS